MCVAEPTAELRRAWEAAGRAGVPEIVALDIDPEPCATKLAQWAELGVSEVLYGFPDGTDEDAAAAHVAQLSEKLSTTGCFEQAGAPVPN